MTLDERTNTLSVGVYVGSFLDAGNLEGTPGSLAQAQNPLLAVVRNKFFAQDCRELSFRKAAHAVQLPQAVLGRNIPLSKKEIVQIFGFNGGHSTHISPDSHAAGQPGDGKSAVSLRKR